MQTIIRKIPVLLFAAFTFLFISCGEDFKESGIEGRWQLQETRNQEGTVVRVDTVFYSFKKDVFEYLKLTTPYEYYHIFGNYKVEGQSLQISIAEDSDEPKGCESCFDWGSTQKNFLIKNHSSSRLELESEGVTYFLRKH